MYTVNESQPWAEAVVIDNGLITFVGSDEAANSYIGASTQVIDLKGRLLLPGIQDSHIHPIGSGLEASACNLNSLSGISEYRSAISSYASANPDVPWILGGGWSMAAFGPGAMPSKAILDEIVPNRPVYLTSQDGHTAWANSIALQLAGIDRETPDPIDGRIDRDAAGEPIGSLQEGAMNLVSSVVPPTSLEENVAGLKYSLALLHSLGITAMQDASVSESTLAAYAAAEKSGDLTMRIVASIRWNRSRGLEQVADIVALRDRFKSELIDTATVKIMQDGVMENYTAAMLEPYLVPSGTRGIPMIEPELLKSIVSRLDAEGFQVHFHAIGDAAIRQSLDSVEQALTDNGQLGHRHHISHLQLIDPADIPRFSQLEVVANFQPLWAYADEYITDLTIPFIGEERARWMYPIKSVKDAGGKLAFGSDWSVSSPNPFEQIETAILRQDAVNNDDEPFIPEERIDIETAVAAFTINAAFVNRLDAVSGSLEVGKSADMIILNQNIFEIAPELISETEVLLTLWQGNAVHGNVVDL